MHGRNIMIMIKRKYLILQKNTDNLFRNVRLKENVGTHTKEFAEAAGGEEGKRTLHQAVKLLAMSALDVFNEYNE